MTSFNSSDFSILEKRSHPSFAFQTLNNDYPSTKTSSSQYQNLPIYLFNSETIRDVQNNKISHYNTINDENPHFYTEETYKKVKTEQTSQNPFSNGIQLSNYVIKNSQTKNEGPYQQELTPFFNFQHLEGFQNFPNYGNRDFWGGHSNVELIRVSKLPKMTQEKGEENKRKSSFSNTNRTTSSYQGYHDHNGIANDYYVAQTFGSINSFSHINQKEASQENYNTGSQLNNYNNRKKSIEVQEQNKPFYLNGYGKSDMALKAHNNNIFEHDQSSLTYTYNNNNQINLLSRGNEQAKYHTKSMQEEINHDCTEEDKTTMISSTSFQGQATNKIEGHLDGFNFEDHELDLHELGSPEKWFIEGSNYPDYAKPRNDKESIKSQSQDNEDFLDGFRIKKKNSAPPTNKKELTLPIKKVSYCESSPSPQKTIHKAKYESPIKIEESTTINQYEDESNSISDEPIESFASRLTSQIDFTVGEEMFQTYSPESSQDKEKETTDDNTITQFEQPIVRKRGRPRKYAPDGSLIIRENVPKPQKLGKKAAKIQAEIEAYERYLEELKKPYVISINANPNDPYQRLVCTKIGDEYQVDMKPFEMHLHRRGDKRPLAPVWTPEEASQDFIDSFVEKVEEIIGKKIDNTVSALKILKIYDMCEETALETIKRSPKYYQTYFKVHHRNAKNRFNH